MATGLVYDPAFLGHVNPPGHPERVERLRAIYAGLENRKFLEKLTPVAAPEATQEDLERVHRPEYVETVLSLAGRDGYLDADTYFSEDSVKAALMAAGGTEALAMAVFSGQLANGVALVRPPGHHAEADRAMGFCLFNNVAVAAAALRAGGASRVAIFDWDVHHGNGTQHEFESDPSVLYVSTHEYPFYPGTGAATEVGVGEGKGATVNIPMPAGSGDTEYLQAMDQVVLPVIEQFKPDVLLISAGFDAYINDPLASMKVTADGFAQMARRVRMLADKVSGGKIVYVLEGGYDLEGLSSGIAACVGDLLDPKAPERPVMPSTHRTWAQSLEAIKRIQSPYWKL